MKVTLAAWTTRPTLLLAIVLLASPTIRALDFGERTVEQWRMLEWSVENPSWSDNEFDVVATAVFRHEPSGRKLATEMFYAGDRTWKLRFTGTALGRWTFSTSSDDPQLDGHIGVVNVRPNRDPRAHGFMKVIPHPQGARWGWEGTDEAFIPQYVMGKDVDAFYDADRRQVDRDKIEREIGEFVDEHGFTGFRLQMRNRWFDLAGRAKGKVNPDPRTFDILEAIIRAVHARGGACHLWMWGKDTGRGGDGPRAVVGGPMSAADRRNLRYIAARLGPIPGWSIGYGYDTENLWASPAELDAWKQFLKEHSGWGHFVGARVGFDEKGLYGEFGKGIPKPPLNEKFNAPIGDEYTAWLGGDYTGYTSYRPLYDRYVAAMEHQPKKPSFEEDRFRIRDAEQWTHKDYDPELTCKGLWHSAMAGGVANIWGHLLPEDDEGGSQPYDSGDARIKHRIRTYATFFGGKRRFRGDFMRDNSIADAWRGTTERSKPSDISVCLRNPDRTHYVFYKENCSAVGMNLRRMKGAQSAVAVDARRAYREIAIGRLSPSRHVWQAPYASDWALAIGDYPGGDVALHRGLHEIEMTAEEELGNPYFDVTLQVEFERPDGTTALVDGFYDGQRTFKARAYCDTPGRWVYRTKSNLKSLDGRESSFFVQASDLPGKLRIHRRDSRQFAYDNGQWFLHIGDTGYRYVVASEPKWQEYIDEAAAAGFTKIRTWFAQSRSTVEALYTEDRSGLALEYWQQIDRRVSYALMHYPHIILQLIPYAEDTEELIRYAQGDRLSQYIARYAQARWSAFPNVHWEISNDREIVTRPDLDRLRGRQISRHVIAQIGRDMKKREPWGTLITNQQARGTGYSFVDEPWSDIITIEDLDQVAGRIALEYRQKGSDPVVLDEDRYENYRDPSNPRYFFRRFMWAHLLSGAHGTYGGLRTYEPYDGSPLRGVQGYYTSNRRGVLSQGAHDFRHVHTFFKDTDLTLVGMRPDDALVGGDHLKAKCIHDDQTYIIYAANPDGDTPRTDNPRLAQPDVSIRLPDGSYAVRWYNPRTGTWEKDETLSGGQPVRLKAPDVGRIAYRDWVILIQRH